MLLQLEIQNLATFKKVRCDFDEGLNIVSGMSGAGKSVLLKSLELCLGGRFSQKLISEGCDKSEVKALFQLDARLQSKYAESLSLETDEILIHRIFRREGRTSNSINDSIVSAELLQKLGQDLAKTLSQDEALGLKDPQQQRLLLDRHGRIDTSTYQALFTQWKEARQKLKELQKNQLEQNQQREFLAFQLKELERLHLQEGELEQLESQVQIQSSSADIEASLERLFDGGSAWIGALSSPLDNLSDHLSQEESWKSLLEEGQDILSHTEAWLDALRSQKSSIEFDPDELAQNEERLVLLRQACKKFHRSEEELIAWRDELRLQCDGPSLEAECEQLQKNISSYEKDLIALGQQCHQERLNASKALCFEVNAVLEQLEMPGGRFAISLEMTKEPQSSGMSEVNFTLKPTENHAPQPLHQTASGGERSRSLLAVSSAMRGAMGTPLLVFDEIDTNIGSRLGRPIAEAFLKLSQQAQVICVTHLAPVAASGKNHLLIEKGQQHSTARHLSKDERIAEIAHMVAGERNDPKALEQADTMFQNYQKLSP